jgi:transglutaminase-like putative cysteine protease
MRPSSRLTVAAGVATGLGIAPLGALFDNIGWMFPAAAAIAVVTCCHAGARILRLPPAAVPVVGALGLLLFVCFGYARSASFAGLLPTGHSVALLRETLRGGLQDIRTYAAPAPLTQGLMLIVTLVAGMMTVLVDTLAVTARRPAVAGLAMLALYAVPTAILARPVLWLYFVASAGGYLVLLLAEGRERLLRWGRPVSHTDPGWQGDPAPIRFTGRQAGIGALVVAVLLPLFLPGISASGLAGLGSGGGNGPGGGTRIDPFAALQGNLNRGGAPVEMFRLYTDAQDLHYLRTQVLDVYTDRGWAPSTPTPTRIAEGELTGQPYGDSRRYEARVEVTGYEDKYLPMPTGTYSVGDLPGGENWQYDEQRSMIFSTVGESTGKQYQVQVAEPTPTVATLEQSQAVAPDGPEMQAWGALPSFSSRFPRSVQNKVNQLIDGKQTPYDRAKAIRDWFSPDHGFIYTTSTQVGDTGSELADFVLEKKQGYCQQYAAAMAVMLRMAGVPARVVLGFTRHGTQRGGYWAVQNTDAHAWVEALFPGLGWIPFDPTPPDPTAPGRIAGSPPWDPPYQAPAATPTGSGGAEPSDVPSGGAAPNKEVDTSSDPAASAGQDSGFFSTAVLLTLLGILVGLLALASPALARLLQRRRRLAVAGRGPPGAAAGAAWDEMVATSVDLNVPLHTDETPRAVARRLVAELSLAGPPAAGVRLIALAEERARYAPKAEVDGDLPTAVRAVRRGMAAERRGRTRLLATLLPASVLQVARRWLVRRSDQVSAQVDRLDADLRRAVRPRRRRRARR